MTVAPKATTGIVLRHEHRTGEYILTGHQAGHSRFSPTLSAKLQLHDVAHLAGLTNGYWLRAAPETDATVWTWVQL